MGWIVLALVLLLGSVGIWAALRAVGARVEGRPGDAADMAAQVIAQTSAFRGDKSEDRVPWDGQEHFKGTQGTEAGGA
jgi:hypothetical protein